MTREEAIKEMIRAYDVLDFSSHMDNRRKEAFNMAKVALEQEPVIDKIKSIVAEWKKDSWTDNLSYECMIKIAEIIDKYEGEEPKI